MECGQHGCSQDFFVAGYKPRDNRSNIFLLHVYNHPTVVEKLVAFVLSFSVVR